MSYTISNLFIIFPYMGSITVKNRQQVQWHKKKIGFTLVELIVVITILVILGTIGLISFQGYQSQARDSNRTETLAIISSGLNISKVRTGAYPYPDGTVSSGSINGITIAYAWEVRDRITSIANIGKVPRDVLSDSYYSYGTDADNQYFQVGTVLENTTAYNPIISNTYADNWYQAKVVGNYNGILRLRGNLYNLPSLIFVGSGSLISTGTFFVVDKMNNLPYKIGDETNLTPKDTQQILSSLTNGVTQTLTGITAPKSMTELIANSWALTSLGYTIDKIGQVSLGSQYVQIGSSSQTNSGTGSSSGDCILWDGATSGTVIEDCTL